MKHGRRRVWALVVGAILVTTVYLVATMQEEDMEAFLMYRVLLEYCESHGKMPEGFDALVTEGYLTRVGDSEYTARNSRRIIHRRNFDIAFGVSGQDLDQAAVIPTEKSTDSLRDKYGKPVVLYRETGFWLLPRSFSQQRSQTLAKVMIRYCCGNSASSPTSTSAPAAQLGLGFPGRSAGSVVAASGRPRVWWRAGRPARPTLACLASDLRPPTSALIIQSTSHRHMNRSDNPARWPAGRRAGSWRCRRLSRAGRRPTPASAACFWAGGSL